MTRPEIEDLWARFVAGALPEADLRELARLLETDVTLREELLADYRVDSSLRGLPSDRDDGALFVHEFLARAAAERTGSAFVRAVESRARGELPTRGLKVAVGLGLAAIAAGVVSAFVLFETRDSRQAALEQRGTMTLPVADRAARDDAPEPRAPSGAADLVRATGDVSLIVDGERQQGRAGQSAPVGSGVWTGEGSAARLQLAGGTTLEVGPETLLASVFGERVGRGGRVVLVSGVLTVGVPPRALPLLVATRHGEVTATGASFRLDASGAATKVVVLAGRARLQGRSGGEIHVEAGRQALISEGASLDTTPTRGGATTITFVVGNALLGPGDEAVRGRLEALGFNVALRTPAELETGQLQSSPLVVVSSTITSTDLRVPLRDLAVPILSWEESLLDDLAMAGARGSGLGGITRRPVAELVIKATNHPLSAGLRDTVKITTSNTPMTWGAPSPLAIWVAHWPGRPADAALFAYESGMPMLDGRPAPARRTALFLFDDTAALLTPDGWALFDAAVVWTSGR